MTDADRRWLYRLGGISALALGVGYVATIPLFAYAGAIPTGGEVALKYLAGKAAVWEAILALSVLTDFLYVPVALALYFALRDVNRIAMLLAISLIGVFVVLDLAVTWTNNAALIALSGSYAAAKDVTQREAYVGAANYASAVLGSRLEIVYAIVDLSFAILLIGYVMLKGIFGRVIAYLGFFVGILGIVALSGWTVAIIANALAATLWILLVGYRFLRLSVPPRPAELQAR